MRLSKPGHEPGINGSGIRDRDHEAGDLAADNLYNSSKPGHWQLPLRQLGYRPAYDCRSTQLGVQGSAHGAKLVEGTWYCPSMPQQLIDAKADQRADKAAPTGSTKRPGRRIAARVP